MMLRLVRCLSATVLVVWLAGCAATPVTTSLTTAPPSDLPATAELTDVPFFAQDDYYCGPSALSATLNYSGVSITPEQLAQNIYTPGRQGTLQTEILTGTRRHGRLAIPVGGMVDGLRKVAGGAPVVILQNLSLPIAPQWHYAVLVGYDLKAGDAILRSDQTRRKVLPLTTLEHTWRRGEFWGVAVAAPTGPVPASTALSAWMGEALALERIDRTDDALAAYATAAAHWPDSTKPLVAAANVHIRQSAWGSAETALQSALNRDPGDAVVLNNLAYVLLQRGACVRAETMAQRAVAAGGPFAAAAQDTLDSIKAAKTCVSG